MFWVGYFAQAATAVLGCADEKKQKLFGIIPKWYQYLPYELNPTSNRCEISFDLKTNPAQLGLVGLSLIDMLLRVAGLVAVIFVIYGGFKLVTSQGEPDAAKSARNTITNALIGVVIALLASTLIGFVASRI